MPLSDNEIDIINSAGTTGDITRRRQAVAVYLSKTGAEREHARSLLAKSYLAATQPSFHLIPRGDAMASEEAFETAYNALAQYTMNFADVSEDTLATCLLASPASLTPLRMIAGLTHNELAVTMQLVRPESKTSSDTLRKFERSSQPVRPTHASMARTIAAAVVAVLNREILIVPHEVSQIFHSKLDRRDTRDGWSGVRRDAENGVPYSALLYQRYTGGAWRQAQDAYSEVKGDNVLELPLAKLFDENLIPYYRTPSGATGARKTAARFNINPGPDFVLPPTSPTVVIESKVGEDGGTVRDKAARIKNLADAAREKGLIACAVVDGKGWRERPNALVDVVVATEGRTYSLKTLAHVLDVPEIAALRPSR